MLHDLTVNSDYATLKQTAAQRMMQRDIQYLLYSRRLKREKRMFTEKEMLTYKVMVVDCKRLSVWHSDGKQQPSCPLFCDTALWYIGQETLMNCCTTLYKQ